MEKGAGPTGDGTYMKDVIKKYCRILIKNNAFTNGFRHTLVILYQKSVKKVKYRLQSRR